MKLKHILTTLLFTLMSTASYAFDVTIAVPPGGATARTAQLLVEILSDNNITAEVKYNQNCAIVKNDIEVNHTPTVYLNSSYGFNDEKCKLNIDNKSIKILDELYSYTYGVCSRADKKLTYSDFSNKNRSSTLATTIVTDSIVKKTLKLLLADHINTVPVGNTGKTREVILGNEFDWAVVDAEWIAKNNEKVNCLFLGSDSEQSTNNITYPSLSKLFEQNKINKYPLLQDVFVIVGANLNDSDIQKFNKEITLIRNSAKWKTFVNSFGNSESNLDKNKFDIINKSLEH